MKKSDTLQRFSFDRLDIRGELVYLEQSWENILARHNYPDTVRTQLGTALAAVALLSLSIKFDGTMILQIRGKGPLRSLVAQISNTGNMRGLARWEGLVPAGNLKEVFGDAQMVISVMKDSGERYQSIVALEGDTLTDALRAYFLQSEQLPSSFQLFVHRDRVSGLFLQALPETHRSQAFADAGAESERDENWNRINMLAATVQEEEMFALTAERLLLNLFHEEEVRLHEPRPLQFACTCSRAKVERTLIAMGHAELLSIINDEDTIKVDCEFCNQHYEFDTTDVDALFHEGDGPPPGSIVH